MENTYALLNYDMDNDKSTPEFEKATKTIDDILAVMVKAIKDGPVDIGKSEIGSTFYSNLHWGTIRNPVSCGDPRIDTHINTAVKTIVEYSDGPEDDGGIGDTATDECIAYEVDRLFKAEPKMATNGLLNRA